MTQKQTVLSMLEQAGAEGVTSNQFYKALLPRFSARIHELRNEGFEITKEPVENGHFLYILVSGINSSTADQRPANRSIDGGSSLAGVSSLSTGQSSRDSESAADWPVPAPTSSSGGAVPGQLFELDEDGPTGPVNPYEWEAA